MIVFCHQTIATPKTNMAMEHAPFENVVPIEHEIFHCHLSFDDCSASMCIKQFPLENKSWTLWYIIGTGKCYACGFLYAHPTCPPCSWLLDLRRLKHVQKWRNHSCDPGLQLQLHLSDPSMSIYTIQYIYVTTRTTYHNSFLKNNIHSIFNNKTLQLTIFNHSPSPKTHPSSFEPQKVNHSPARSARPDTAQSEDDECYNT